MSGSLALSALLVTLILAGNVHADRPTITDAMRPFVIEDSNVIALVHARVIDGTGAPAREGQTLVLRDGLIQAVGPDGKVPLPVDARVIDLTGKSVLPGLVQLHEHLWMYGGSVRGVNDSYPKLYLAAGVTSIRTAGSHNPYVDLKTRNDIEAGQAVGPWMDLTIYMDLFGAPRLSDAQSTRKYLDFWLDSGFTSVKAYGYSNRTALKTAIDIAHARGLKVTGHLCMVSYREAAELGIDNIEHGFAMAPDFLPDELAPRPALPGAIDSESEQACGAHALRALQHVDPQGSQAAALIDYLVKHDVAVTSTLPALEDLVPDIAPQKGLQMLAPPFREYHSDYRAKLRNSEDGMSVLSADSLHKTAVLERAFMKAGGLLVSGTDPAVPSGGVIAGYSNVRQLELMVQYGFSPLEAIRVSTLNGATYLQRQEQIGSIAPDKQADLMIVTGDPSRTISDIGNVYMVFKQGIGYDPDRLRESVRGKVGLQ